MKYVTMLAAMLLLIGCGGPKTEAPKTDALFAKDVQPMFAQNCMPCHSGAPDAKSPYDLTKYDGVMGNGKDSVPNVIAGKPDSSILYTMLKDGKMPPAGALPAAEVDLVMKWITAGAKNN